MVLHLPNLMIKISRKLNPEPQTLTLNHRPCKWSSQPSVPNLKLNPYSIIPKPYVFKGQHHWAVHCSPPPFPFISVLFYMQVNE